MCVTSRQRLLAIFILLVLATARTSSQTPPSSPCTSPEYREFDFWIGDWDVFEAGSSTSTAHVRVDRILGGCVVQERYEDNTGTAGESFTTYDVGRKLWHQTWVTNRGRLLTIEGGKHDSAMLLAGSYYLDNGNEIRVRGSWEPAGGNVREIASTSSDDGKTWKPWFDLSFRPRAHDANGASGKDDDAKTVAELDEQFQAAVKANDPETMDKILADDFILVTGSGKVFNKQQSLNEARSRSTVYEHQEDTERTVRVWGDTAVVTAKLWVKGVRDGKPIDATLWFSDTYIRRPEGWRYVFGQASLPMPKATP
jgi:ketosteroid isomerase-like protein